MTFLMNAGFSRDHTSVHDSSLYEGWFVSGCWCEWKSQIYLLRCLS